MENETVGMAASKEETASVDVDAVAIADVDAVAGMEAEAEAVLPARSATRYSPSKITIDAAGASCQDPGKICWPSLGSPAVLQGTTKSCTCCTTTCEVEGKLRR